MGGHQGGLRCPRKLRTEECLQLSISEFRRQGLLAGGWQRGLWGWGQEGDPTPHAVVEYEISIGGDDGGSLWLQYAIGENRIHKCVSLTWTAPNYGGRRWWFRCPATGRLVSKLYLPAGAVQFASRQAHNLTYRSCQESGQFQRRCKWIAKILRRQEAEVQAAIRSAIAAKPPVRGLLRDKPLNY